MLAAGKFEKFLLTGGTMLGSAGAFVCYLLAIDSGSHLLLALSYAGFVLNLFNLIPVSPLDGGRIVYVISPLIWFLGFPMLVALFIWRPSPLLILIAVFALPQLWNAFKDKNVLFRRGRGASIATGGWDLPA